jgi:tetratricopeptide (TPR) repeat protein
MAKLTKRQVKQDKFVTGLLKSQEFFNEHKAQIFIGIAALLVVAIAIVFFITNAQSSDRAAEDEFGVANMYVRDFINTFETDQNQDGIPDGSLDSSLISLNNAKLEFERIVENRSGSRQAKLATFYLGSISYQMGEFQNAESYFQKFLDKYYVDKHFEAAAKQGLASCKEALRDFEAAGMMFMEIVTDYTDYPLRLDALHKATINYAKAGMKEEALEALALLEDMPNSRNVVTDAKRFLYEKNILDPYTFESN